MLVPSESHRQLYQYLKKIIPSHDLIAVLESTTTIRACRTILQLIRFGQSTESTFVSPSYSIESTIVLWIYAFQSNTIISAYPFLKRRYAALVRRWNQVESCHRHHILQSIATDLAQLILRGRRDLRVPLPEYPLDESLMGLIRNCLSDRINAAILHGYLKLFHWSDLDDAMDRYDQDLVRQVPPQWIHQRPPVAAFVPEAHPWEWWEHQTGWIRHGWNASEIYRNTGKIYEHIKCYQQAIKAVIEGRYGESIPEHPWGHESYVYIRRWLVISHWRWTMRYTPLAMRASWKDIWEYLTRQWVAYEEHHRHEIVLRLRDDVLIAQRLIQEQLTTMVWNVRHERRYDFPLLTLRSQIAIIMAQLSRLKNPMSDTLINTIDAQLHSSMPQPIIDQLKPPYHQQTLRYEPWPWWYANWYEQSFHGEASPDGE